MVAPPSTTPAPFGDRRGRRRRRSFRARLRRAVDGKREPGFDEPVILEPEQLQACLRARLAALRVNPFDRHALPNAITHGNSLVDDATRVRCRRMIPCHLLHVAFRRHDPAGEKVVPNGGQCVPPATESAPLFVAHLLPTFQEFLDHRHSSTLGSCQPVRPASVTVRHREASGTAGRRACRVPTHRLAAACAGRKS